MNQYPECSEKIIVYVVANGIGQWYATEKEPWFLDRVAFSKAFGVQPTTQEIAFVKNLNAGNGDLLLNEIEPYKVCINELREKIASYQPLFKDESILEMRPSLYVNIDEMLMKNVYPEPSGIFEKYAPVNWRASYENFLSEIPMVHNYWCVNGNNYLESHA